MKIAISSWSMNRAFFTGQMTMADFIKMARETYNVDGIEMVHWMIPDMPTEQGNIAKAFGMFSSKVPAEQAMGGKLFNESMNAISKALPGNIETLKEKLKEYNISVRNMPIDFGNISQLDADARKADLDVIKLWIDIAALLDCKAARVNTGKQPDGTFDLSITADSYRELAAYAETKKVNLVLENHGGMSADPDNILKLFQMVNHPNFRICPDFGNFDPEIRYDALDKIFALNPVLVHAKTYDFSETGSHDHFDFAKCMNTAKKHGYDGWYSVEFEGETGDQPDGIRRTVELLKQNE